ncbi:hypothetical protein [Cupriavidus basilensis]
MAGRKPFVPTDEDRRLVLSLAGFGAPHEYIASQVSNPQTGKPLDPKSLRRHFRAELDTGKNRTNALVAQALFKQATGTGRGAVPAAIFWLKTQAQWKEAPQAVEMTGKDGGPVSSVVVNTTPEKYAEVVRQVLDEY